MRYFIIFLTTLFCERAIAGEWYQGMWVYDAALTQRNNPDIPPRGMKEVKDAFDKFAGKINVTPRRVKGRRARLGVPYRVVGRGKQAVMIEVKGPGIEIVKALNPDLRKQSLRCKAVRINSNVMAFEVPEMDTIRMYLRRIR